MLGIGPCRYLGLEVFVGQRIGQLAVDFQMLELLAVSQQIKDEDLHRIPLPGRYFASTHGRCRQNSFQPKSECDLALVRAVAAVGRARDGSLRRLSASAPAMSPDCATRASSDPLRI